MLMKFHTSRMFQSSHHRLHDSPIDANFTTTPQLLVKLILAKASAPMPEKNPQSTKMSLMNSNQRHLPTGPTTRPKIVVVN